MELHYHFPDPHKPMRSANWSKYGDTDNLQKFLFDAMQRVHLIGDDRNVVSSNSRKIIARTDGDLNKNFVMHGGYAMKVMLDNKIIFQNTITIVTTNQFWLFSFKH